MPFDSSSTPYPIYNLKPSQSNQPYIITYTSILAAHTSTLTLNSGGPLPSLPSHVSPLVPDRYPAMVPRNVQRPLLHRAGTELVLVLHDHGSRVSFSVQRICHRELVGTSRYVDSINISFCGIDHSVYYSVGMVRTVHNNYSSSRPKRLLSSTSRSPLCFYIYKCSTAILRFSLLLCAPVLYLKDSVLNGDLAAI